MLLGCCNLLWAQAVFEELYPPSTSTLSNTQSRRCLEKVLSQSCIHGSPEKSYFKRNRIFLIYWKPFTLRFHVELEKMLHLPGCKGGATERSPLKISSKKWFLLQKNLFKKKKLVTTHISKYLKILQIPSDFCPKKIHKDNVALHYFLLLLLPDRSPLKNLASKQIYPGILCEWHRAWKHPTCTPGEGGHV